MLGHYQYNCAYQTLAGIKNKKKQSWGESEKVLFSDNELALNLTKFWYFNNPCTVLSDLLLLKWSLLRTFCCLDHFLYLSLWWWLLMFTTVHFTFFSDRIQSCAYSCPARACISHSLSQLDGAMWLGSE